MPRRAAPILAMLAVAAAALVGCGDDANAFKEDYNEAIRPLSSLGDDIGSSLGGAAGQSNREIAAQFKRLADRMERTRKNLAGLDPPDDARDEFDELVSSMDQAVKDLRAVADSARSGNPGEAAEASETLVETGERIREAETDFQDAVEG